MPQMLFWLAATVIFLLIEWPTMGLTTIWFAGGSLVAGLLAGFSCPFPIQFACCIRSFVTFYQATGNQVPEHEPDKDKCGQFDREGSGCNRDDQQSEKHRSCGYSWCDLDGADGFESGYGRKRFYCCD